MPAHEGEAVPFGEREAPAANLPLDAAAVDDQRVLGYKGRVLFQPVGAAAGVNGKQDQVALRNGGFVQPSVDCAGKHGKGQHTFVSLNGVDGVPLQSVGSGKGAADQAKTQNTDFHTRTSRICRTFRLISSNWGGVMDWAPSHSAWAGSLWTSTMMPSAPAAVAA